MKINTRAPDKSQKCPASGGPFQFLDDNLSDPPAGVRMGICRPASRIEPLNPSPIERANGAETRKLPLLLPGGEGLVITHIFQASE